MSLSKTEIKKSTEMNLIDLLKLFFSFCVVGIHTNVFSELPNLEGWLVMHLVLRLGVPFFYVTSGFFLGRKLNSDSSKLEIQIHNYRKNLISPLLVWGGMWLFMYFVKYLKEGMNALEILYHIIRQAIFYPPGAMWFVAACIISSFILQKVILKKYNKKIVTIVAIVLFIFALLANTYYFLAEGTILQQIVDFYLNNFLSARNGVFLFIYFWTGYLISCDKIQSRLDNNKKLVNGILIASGITLVVEVLFVYGKNVGDDSSLFVSYVILVPLMVYKLTKYNLNCNLPYKEMRKLSTVVYYIHRFLIAILNAIFNFSNVVVFVLVNICCLAIYFVVRRSKHPFIRKIF